MQRSGRIRRILVTTDGTGVVSHAGAFLVSQLSDRVGLTDALSTAMAPTRRRARGHDPGHVLRDLAVMLADGGDCISDLAVLREQSALFGEVASTATAWRVLDSIDDAELGRLRAARATARRRAWAAGAAPARVVLDIDATLVTAHSEKEGATPTYKRGFGFHPLLCFVDLDEEGAGGDALAGIVRPGRAGANDVADHIAVLDLALAQLPDDWRPRPGDPTSPTVLVRADSAGGTYGFGAAVRARGCQFSLGLGLDKPVQQAILKLPESAWAPALDTDEQPRDGAEVAELTGLLDLTRWPAGTRAIVRRERPHPGAQLRFTDHDGWRFQVLLTDTGHGVVAHQLAGLEVRHRAHARVEDRIRAAKATGLVNFPCRALPENRAWLELVLAATDLLAWTRALCLTGPLRRAEPKALRHRLLHVAARLARSSRHLILRLSANWPWTCDLHAAFAALDDLPVPAS